ncbi:MAG: hypothetical protein HYX92_21935 [Chloroflexi bacterium]|nr:hypothetical protein [Chloroflexota bacterium]
MDDADVFAISGIIALALALVLISFLPFTNAWVAGITVLAIPLVTVVLAIVISKGINRQRRRLAKAAREPRKQALSGEPAKTDFIQAWLRKGKESPRVWTCSIDTDCPPGHICIDGRCEPA